MDSVLVKVMVLMFIRLRKCHLFVVDIWMMIPLLSILSVMLSLPSKWQTAKAEKNVLFEDASLDFI